VFLINVPFGLLVLAILVRSARAPERTTERRVDFPGALLFAASITSLLAALSLLGQDPGFVRTVPFWVLIASSVALLVAFAWQELRTPEPVLDLRLVFKSPFLAVNAYNFIFGACVFGFFTLIPYYAVVQYGMSTVESGAILTPRSVVMMATSAVASFFLIRLGYRLPMLAGMACIVATMLLLSRGWSDVTLLGLHIGTFALLSAEVALGGMGMGLAAPSSNNALLDLLPERAAVVTGIRGMFRSTGGVVGTALIVLWLELSPDKAVGLRSIYSILALGLLTTVPLTLLIPDTARAKRQARARATPAESAPAAP
jgi:Na+/melibiose symporter-like transporter